MVILAYNGKGKHIRTYASPRLSVLHVTFRLQGPSYISWTDLWAGNIVGLSGDATLRSESHPERGPEASSSMFLRLTSPSIFLRLTSPSSKEMGGERCAFLPSVKVERLWTRKRNSMHSLARTFRSHHLTSVSTVLYLSLISSLLPTSSAWESAFIWNESVYRRWVRTISILSALVPL